MIGAAALLAGGITAWFLAPSTPVPRDPQVDEILRNEAAIAEIMPLTSDLARSVRNLTLPDPRARRLFASTVETRGLERADSGPGSWGVAEISSEIPAPELRLWAEFFETVEHVSRAQVSVVSGSYEPDGGFTTLLRCTGLVRRAEGWAGIYALQDVTWERSQASWRIRAWTQRSFDLQPAPELLFEEVLARALPDAALLERAQRSVFREQLVAWFEGTGSPQLPNDPLGSFELHAGAEHPAVSVVDLDADGWDDLYLLQRRGPALFLRNRGDGTFEDRTADFGLGFADSTTCALFADFDNDGDADLFLGRHRLPSLFALNEGGRFRLATPEEVGCELPPLVASAAAADFNGDGLLDLYLARYHPLMFTAVTASGERSRNGGWRAAFGVPAPARRPKNSLLNGLGPPNVLLVNRGGRFEVAAESAQVAGDHRTLQASWGDYDADGDPDLYVCNDAGLDRLYRNDGEAGFVEVGEELIGETHSFGMGACWGDYDGDGRLDVFATSMSSKAGARITGQVSGMNQRLVALAHGNNLYRQGPERFEKTSADGQPASAVARTGWSWGGTFGDLDNDGWLDLYVTSGFYTPPPRVARPGDW